MIYLIGGVPRCGKTTLSRKLATKLGIECVNFDTITKLFQEFAPQYGLRNEMDEENRVLLGHPMNVELIGGSVFKSRDIIIEGDHIDPNHCQEYLKISSGRIKCVFLGSNDITSQEFIAKCAKNNGYCWFNNIAENDIKLKIAGEMIQRSKELNEKIKLIDIDKFRYYNTSKDFETTISEALDFLLNSD